jgi:predicted ester cyclase
MSAEENKALVLRTTEAFEKDGPEASFAMFDPACTFPDLALYGLPPTLEGYKQFSTAAYDAFTDFSSTLEEIVAEGDKVMMWGVDSATHTGTWRNIPATNKRVSWRAVGCYRFAQGKVIECRFMYDTFSFLQQVGAISLPQYKRL